MRSEAKRRSSIKIFPANISDVFCYQHWVSLKILPTDNCKYVEIIPVPGNWSISLCLRLHDTVVYFSLLYKIEDFTYKYELDMKQIEDSGSWGNYVSFDRTVSIELLQFAGEQNFR